MKTFKYADLCTSHMTKEDSGKLQNMADNLNESELTVYSNDYGFFVMVPEYETERFENIGFSEALLSLLKRCSSENIGVIRFDCDALESDDLLTFDW